MKICAGCLHPQAYFHVNPCGEKPQRGNPQDFRATRLRSYVIIVWRRLSFMEMCVDKNNQMHISMKAHTAGNKIFLLL